MFSPRIKIVALLITTIFFVFDRFFKFLAINFQTLKVSLIGDFFKFSFTGNFYISFSLPLSGWWLNILITLITFGLLLIFIISYQKKQFFESWLFLSIALGSASNLYDRLMHGFVIDYLDLKYFTVFNLADVMIVIGIIAILFLQIKKERNLFSPFLEK